MKRIFDNINYSLIIKLLKRVIFRNISIKISLISNLFVKLYKLKIMDYPGFKPKKKIEKNSKGIFTNI